MARLLLFFLLVMTGLSAGAQQPELEGGLEKFILANKVYPLYSLQNCIDGTVTIGFKLNSRGEVYTSEVRKGVGTDLDDEALRLIRMSSGKWTVPAGYDTTFVLIVPVSFSLSGYDCTGKSDAEKAAAVRAYQVNAGLTNVVLNFYRNKAAGKAGKEKDEENRIIALKNSLGYNEEYLKNRIGEGKKKLEQKDRQGACEDFLFVKYMGSDLADELLSRYCN